MNLTNLPSPGTGMNAQKLQIEACKAISSVEISAAHYVSGKTDRADKLAAFFDACRVACNAVATAIISPVVQSNQKVVTTGEVTGAVAENAAGVPLGTATITIVNGVITKVKTSL